MYKSVLVVSILTTGKQYSISSHISPAHQRWRTSEMRDVAEESLASFHNKCTQKKEKTEGKVNEIFFFFPPRAISFKNSFTLLTLTYFLIEKYLGSLQGRRTKAWEGCKDHVEPAQNSSRMWQPSAQVSRHFSEGLKRNTAAHPPLKLCYFSPSLLQLRTKG